MSKSHRPAQHGRPGEMDIAGFEHNGFIKRPTLPASVVFADEDAQPHRVARQGHDLRPYAPSGETPNSQ
jgi:hypothetical protein